MPSLPLHPPDPSRSPSAPNPLPPLLQTPYGLALLEIQGTLHTSSSNPDIAASSFSFPSSSAASSSPSLEPASRCTTSIGRLLFPPHYYNDGSLSDGEHSSRMRQVYLYVGRHQRLTGEVRKLGKPVAVLRKRVDDARAGDEMRDVDTDRATEEVGEELEILEIVRFKILFAGRPEPVGQ